MGWRLLKNLQKAIAKLLILTKCLREGSHYVQAIVDCRKYCLRKQMAVHFCCHIDSCLFPARHNWPSVIPAGTQHLMGLTFWSRQQGNLDVEVICSRAEMKEVVTLDTQTDEAWQHEVTWTIGGCQSGLNRILTACPVFFPPCQGSCLSWAQSELVSRNPVIFISVFGDSMF